MVTSLVVGGVVVLSGGPEVLRVGMLGGPWVDGGDGGPCVETNTTGCFLVEGGDGGPKAGIQKIELGMQRVLKQMRAIAFKKV